MKAQGRSVESAERVVREALAVEAAGAVALVVEAVPSEVVSVFDEQLSIPVIGIGAGPTDGQVLVYHDLLGISQGKMAKFVRQFANVGDETARGLAAYVSAVRERSFPGPEHQYASSEEAVAAARGALGTP